MPKTALGGLSAKLASIRAGTLVVPDPVTPRRPVVPTQVVAAELDEEPVVEQPEGPVEEPTDDLDESMFLLLESDGEETDEDQHREALLDEFRESLRGDDEENLLDELDPDTSTDVDPEEELETDLPPAPADVVPTEVIASDEQVFNTSSEENLLELFTAFYRINKQPTDDQFHALAESLGIPHEQLEEALFKLIGESMSDDTVGEHAQV
jgi:hypothetical protein